jgi:hypothetical protein
MTFLLDVKNLNVSEVSEKANPERETKPFPGNAAA